MKLRRTFNLLIVLILLLFVVNAFSVKASLVPLKINGTTIKYRGTNIDVQIPTEYIKPDADFRGVWVTPIVGGNLARFQSVYQYKEEITSLLDIMEYYNLNALIFHVRPFNDALYTSSLNPWSSYLKGFNVDPGWDPLPWIIEETHKRGIEFHAWLNPYRITNSGATNAVDLSKKYPSANAASNPENILIASGRAILNPGEPAVRQFLIDTVMEIIENYDVDAIHFDDYFYINGVDDSHTRSKPGYNPYNLGVSDWRREQVNTFIRDLSNTMRQFNLAHNRVVQLGISPTGIYKNGGSGFAEGGPANYDNNGNFITNGSNTAGQEHYASYLYADTKKWVDNEWIDYIIPQTYWAFDRGIAGYADVVDWWAKVVRYKKVNLYTGMGIYMADSSANYGWSTNYDEAPMQVLYNTKHDYVQGTSIFSYSQLIKGYYDTANDRIKYGLEAIRTQYWSTPSLMPEIRTYNQIVPTKLENLKANTLGDINELSWDHSSDATKYAIYRSTTTNFTNEDLIAVIGPDKSSENVKYLDENINQEYYYKVVPMSRTNTLGEAGIVKASDNEVIGIGEITGVNIPGDFYPGQDFKLYFNKINGLEEVNYSLYVSTDLKEWEKIDKQFEDYGTYMGMDISLEEKDSRVFLKIQAENNQGMSSKIVEIPYLKIPNIPPINNIYLKGQQSAGLTLEVFWDAYINSYHSDISYELEISLDDIEYSTHSGLYEVVLNRVYTNISLPHQKNVFVRVNIINNKTMEVIKGEPIEIEIGPFTFQGYLHIFHTRRNNRINDILS